MNHLDRLESKSVGILREAYANLSNLIMLWSAGKDSTVLLWLTRKAFFGHVPFPLLHVDTGFKMPEIIEFRDRLTKEWKLNMIVGKNENSLQSKQTYPDGILNPTECCRSLKTETLKHTLDGTWKRYRFNHQNIQYEEDRLTDIYSGVIVGVRADEEGSRSKERYFSFRNKESYWAVAEQPPEIWSYYNTILSPGNQIRVHPLLDWTELNIWEYIKREDIPITNLYFNRGDGMRYRTIGCETCTTPIRSYAINVDEIINELVSGDYRNVPERSGRAQDNESGGLETLRLNGYM